MPHIANVNLIPHAIHFGAGRTIHLDRVETIEGAAESVHVMSDKMGIGNLSPTNVIFNVTPNTTGDMIGPMLACFEQVNPTAAIVRGIVTSIEFNDGAVIPSLDVAEQVPTTRRGRGGKSKPSSIQEAMENYGIKFSLNKETGIYVLTAHSTDVKSVTVDVNYWNANQAPRP